MNDVKYISNLISGEDIYYLKDAEARTNLADKVSKEEYAEGIVVDSTRYYTVTGAEKEYWNSKVNPPSYSAPTAKNLTYTGEAQDLLNPGSSTSGSIQYSTDEVNWSTTVPQATNAGTYTVYWKFAGSEIVYVDSTAINVTIAKANPTYTAPTAKTLTYNGGGQDLVNAGTTNDGTFKYGFAPGQYIDPINGHEYVDLGLPNGTKWAKCNVGANIEEGYGNYYMYGKGANVYNSSDSIYRGTENPLSLGFDTARQVMGGSWHMPTMPQLMELKMNTTQEGATINGVQGVKFIAKNGSGNYIFIPTAGYYNHERHDEGELGYIWGSSPDGSFEAWFLECYSNGYSSPTTIDRKNGYSVRGVIDSMDALPQGTNADTYTVYWKLEGDENHNDVTGTIEVTIAKVTPTVTAPTAKTLTYNGSAQWLINAGSTNFGTLQYSLDDETYGTSIPSGTNAGNYTVYYRVVGDSNINDVAAQSVSCSIGKINRNVRFTPTDANGHTFIDLGLPSSTKWAPMNVGANAPEAYGNWYKYGLGANPYDSSQADYTGTEDPLAASADTATQVLGGDWHMPTKAQLNELIANTTYTWTTVNGTNGGLFTSNINGNSIFIPAAGNYHSNSHYLEGTYGSVLSSTPDRTFASYCSFSSSGVSVGNAYRLYAYSVRGVIDFASSPKTTLEVGQTTTVITEGSPTTTITSSDTNVATANGMTITVVGGGSTTITITIAGDTNYNTYTYSYTLNVPYPNGIYAAYADGSMRTAANADTNAIGVAVITDNCSFIIDKTNDTGKAWDSKFSTNGVIAGCFATNDTNTAKTNYTGVSNTNAIAAVASGGEAAKYCRSCSKTIAGKTVYGYLGTCGEWRTACDNKTTVDSIMSTIGGTAINLSEYWTSTLYLSDSESAWVLSWQMNYAHTDYKNFDFNYVRPFYEIS